MIYIFQFLGIHFKFIKIATNHFLSNSIVISSVFLCNVSIMCVSCDVDTQEGLVQHNCNASCSRYIKYSKKSSIRHFMAFYHNAPKSILRSHIFKIRLSMLQFRLFTELEICSRKIFIVVIMKFGNDEFCQKHIVVS